MDNESSIVQFPQLGTRRDYRAVLVPLAVYQALLEAAKGPDAPEGGVSPSVLATNLIVAGVAMLRGEDAANGLVSDLFRAGGRRL